MKKILAFLLVGSFYVFVTGSTYKTQQSTVLFSIDYDHGYNQSYDLGTTGNTSLFASRYATALNNDRFELAEGILDGYNAGCEAGPNQSPGMGNGGSKGVNASGCKIVLGSPSLAAYMNTLGIGCYANY